MDKRAGAKDTGLQCGAPRRRPMRRAMVAVGAMLAVAAPIAAVAQSLTPGINPQRFEPASGAGQTGFISTSPAATPETLPSEPTLGAEPEISPESSLGGEPTSALPGAETAAPVYAPPPPRPQRPHRRLEPEDPYEPLGLRLGSFIVKPAVEISGGYDSNPDRAVTPRGGAVLTVAPEVHVQSDWSRHELRADVRGRYTTYPGFQATPSLDQPFVDSKIAGRIDVTRRTRIDLEGRFSLTTENPNSPDLPAGLAELPITMTGGVTAGVAHRFNRFELGVSGSYDRVIYGDSTLTNGATFSNEDRNYDQYGVRLRGSYELVPGVKPFVEVAADRRIHDLPVDFSGFRRDSTGSEVRVGSTIAFTPQLSGLLSVGYAMRDYEDPALQNLTGLVADGELAWAITPLTKLKLTARSRISESTLAGVSGVLVRDVGAEVEHSFRRWLIGTLRFEYGFDDYVGSPREDQRYAVSGILTYKLSRLAQLRGEARRQWLTSNVPSAEYTANIFLLGLRLQR